MGITIIDQGPELFWFVSNALLQEEIPLKHVQNINTGEQNILHDLPEIVIINGDDKSLRPEIFINKMRNHVFARNTLFIVFTADTSVEFKKALLIAGAGQILYRDRGNGPPPKYFASIIKWFLNSKNPDQQIFEYKPVPFTADGDFTTFGRIGWIAGDQCLIETNLDLNKGQTIEIKNTLFDELEVKNVKLECIDKNKIGRYYFYANSLLCKIISKGDVKDKKTINSWIKNNQDLSKQKTIKIVYFESDPDYREQIRSMIKFDSRYCARGYSNLNDLQDVLNYQQPQLVLINREVIQKESSKFDALKNFMKNSFCYCVTYANSTLFKVDEFKKKYEFAMHSPTAISVSLLESMILKLEEKLPAHLKKDEKKLYFNKHSAYSRITLHSPCKMVDLGPNGAGVELPFTMNNFSACSISSNGFSVADIFHEQYFRSFINKTGKQGIYHRLVFMGQNTKEHTKVKDAVELITKYGYERWIKGETSPDVLIEKAQAGPPKKA